MTARRWAWPFAARQVAELGCLLGTGALAALPSDTLYGFAADPRHEGAVARLWQLKRLPQPQPLIVLLESARALEALGARVPAVTLAVLERLWPAPLTAIVPLALPLPASAGLRSLAVRVPASAAVREVLAVTGPLTSTSCNFHGEAPLANAEAIWREFGAALAVVADAGELPVRALPSTLIDLTGGAPRLLRAGAYSETALAEAFGIKV